MTLQYDVKLGNVGDLHVGLVGGKVILGVDIEDDLQAQLAALAAAHTSGVLGEALKLAVEGANAYVAANPAPASV